MKKSASFISMQISWTGSVIFFFYFKAYLQPISYVNASLFHFCFVVGAPKALVMLNLVHRSLCKDYVDDSENVI